ncbi:MAG: diguanylate cyclase [Candidatus Omnitrophota bacterium]
MAAGKAQKNCYAKLESLYQNALSFAQIGLYRHKFDGTMLFIDKGALSILDLESQYADTTDVKGRDIGSLFHYIRPSDKLRDEVRKKGRVRGVEYHFRTISGKEKWVEHDSYVIRDDDTGEDIVQAVVRDITPKKKYEARLKIINECFLSFGSDPHENMERLLAACGEITGAFCVVYEHLDRDMIRTVAQWNAPAGYEMSRNVEGLMSYDIVRERPEHTVIMRNLQEGDYADADPLVKLYGLKTCLGVPVRFGGSNIGGISVLFTRDFTLEEDDRMMLAIVASAVAVEEERLNAEIGLRESHERYHSIFQNSPISLWEEDFSDVKLCLERMRDEGVQDFRAYFRGHPESVIELMSKIRIIDVNEATVRLYRARNKNDFRMGLSSLFTEESYECAAEELIAIANGSRTFEYESVTQTLTGMPVDIYMKWSVVPGYEYSYSKVLVSIIDISALKKAERELRNREAQFRNLAENSPNMIFITQKGKIIYANQRCIETLGYPREMLYSDRFNFFKLIEKKEMSSVRDDYRQHLSGKEVNQKQVTLLTREGAKLQVIITTKLIDYGSGKSVLGIVTDITDKLKHQFEKEYLNKELEKSNRKLKRLVLRDPDTGLYNHRYLVDAVDSEFERAKRYAGAISIMMLDIDYFKSINDLYGHKFGDLIIKQLASLLKRKVRAYDIVIRTGGEEFIVISPDADRAMALSLGERILDDIHTHDFGDRKHKVKLKVSIAVSSYPEDEVYKGTELIDCADRVIEVAKEDGGDRICTSEDLRKKKVKVSSRRHGIKGGVKHLKTRIELLHKQAKQSMIESIFAFAKTIELRDYYTGKHAEKTVLYATEIAKKMGVPKADAELIRQAAMLHDLGKIGISDKILLKASKLTKEEFNEIKKHPQIGADIIRPIHFLRDIVPLITYHHEWWNGKGYPNGLHGEEIPIGARIIALADGFHALSSDRPYRKAFSREQIVKIILSESGVKYDPAVVKAFLQILKKK